MATLIFHKEPIAKKQYSCCGCATIRNMFGTFKGFTNSLHLTVAEKRILIKVKQDNYKIQNQIL